MDHPNPQDYWRHRRRLAYWSMALLTTSLVLALGGYVQEPMIPLVEGLCWTLAVVILSYYGGNAAEALARRGKP